SEPCETRARLLVYREKGIEITADRVDGDGGVDGEAERVPEGMPVLVAGTVPWLGGGRRGAATGEGRGIPGVAGEGGREVRHGNGPAGVIVRGSEPPDDLYAQRPG